MLRTEGFVHFTIPVKDLDRSEAFYRDVMGFRKLRRNNHMVFMEAHGTSFVLTLSENPVEPNRGDKHDIHTAFKVTGAAFEAAKAHLAKVGHPVFREEDRPTGTFQGRSAYFHDPDRNVLEIIDLVRGPVADGE
ncbi:MAG: glyoxalase family protein [Hyphomicrobiales bacterium]|nr:glyoxalase family protein [Hyphomicrobiales bacterium]